jgi:hypothetical protein
MLADVVVSASPQLPFGDHRNGGPFARAPTTYRRSPSSSAAVMAPVAFPAQHSACLDHGT